VPLSRPSTISGPSPPGGPRARSRASPASAAEGKQDENVDKAGGPPPVAETSASPAHAHAPAPPGAWARTRPSSVLDLAERASTRGRRGMASAPCSSSKPERLGRRKLRRHELRGGRADPPMAAGPAVRRRVARMSRTHDAAGTCYRDMGGRFFFSAIRSRGQGDANQPGVAERTERRVRPAKLIVHSRDVRLDLPLHGLERGRMTRAPASASNAGTCGAPQRRFRLYRRTDSGPFEPKRAEADLRGRTGRTIARVCLGGKLEKQV